MRARREILDIMVSHRDRHRLDQLVLCSFNKRLDIELNWCHGKSKVVAKQSYIGIAGHGSIIGPKSSSASAVTDHTARHDFANGSHSFCQG